MEHDYCEGTPEYMEKWIIAHIRPEFRNGYREVVGLPIKKKEDECIENRKE